MPLDIYDINGGHIGIIKKSFYNRPGTYLIAITDEEAKDIEMDLYEIKNYVAGGLNCKTLFGKIKEEELRKVIGEILEEDEYKHLRTVSYEDVIKTLFLIQAKEDDIEKVIKVNIKEESVKGYLLFDINNIEVKDGKIIIRENIDYINDKTMYKGMPVYGKVIDYPTVETEIMGLSGLFLGGDIVDLGGRNHSHTTKIEVVSGNFKDIIELPILLNVKKDMNIQFYLFDDEIRQVFVDGVLYKFIKG